MSRRHFQGIASTTHIDKHGERVSREFLEQQVIDFKNKQQPLLGFWNHFNTLPPITITTDQLVEKREDGEYQLVVKGEILEEGDFEDLLNTNIIVNEITEKEIEAAIIKLQHSNKDELKILYDPRNFNPSDVDPIIASLNELVPVKSGHYIRKAEFPHPVIFVLLAFATGFIARLGEVAANKVLKKASSFVDEFNNRFTQLVEYSNQNLKPDLVFSIQIPNSNVDVEGAIEEVDKEVLKGIWMKLPELYCLAEKIINDNRNGYFYQLNFLFNPITKKWEVNYLITRKTNRVILGPRYIDPSHPLRKRWETERENYKVENQNKMGMSVGFIPTELNKT
jgi:hypothetical protein